MTTSLFGRQVLSAVEASEALKGNYIANTALTNEKTKLVFKEMMANIAAKNADAALAKAKELESLWNIGEHVNWKQILESGTEAVNTTIITLREINLQDTSKNEKTHN